MHSSAASTRPCAGLMLKASGLHCETLRLSTVLLIGRCAAAHFKSGANSAHHGDTSASSNSPPRRRQTSPARKPTRRRQDEGPAPSSSTALGCAHFQECSGCTRSTQLTAPAQHAEAVPFFQSLGLHNCPLVAGAFHGWRWRAKLAVRGTPGAPVVGLFRKGSHDCVHIPSCVAHHPAINAAAALVTRVAAALRTPPYNERGGPAGSCGLLRYLQLTAVTPGLQPGSDDQPPPTWAALPAPARLYGGGAGSPAPASVQVVLVVAAEQGAGPGMEAALHLAEGIWAAGGPIAGRSNPIIHSVWLNLQPATGTASNSVLGRVWVHVHGPRHAWEAWGGLPICTTPASFVQANYGAFAAALAAMRAALPRGGRQLVDMHAGVGSIGLSLVAGGPGGRGWGEALRCVEVNPDGAAAFEASAAALRARWRGGPARPPPRLEYVAAAAGSRPAEFLAGADAVIVDPPRKGLEPFLLAALADLSWERVPQPLASPGTLEAPAQPTSLPPRRLLYLSCGWNALQRDAAALLGLAPRPAPSGASQGGGQGRVQGVFDPRAWVQVRPACWRLLSAQAFLFFPGTDAIETLAVFEEVL